MTDDVVADVELESTTRGLARNTLWVLAGHLAGKLAGLAFFVVVARVLGTREYGYFTFAISFVPLFLVLGTLGLELVTVREIARAPKRMPEVFAAVLAIRLATGALGLLVAIGVAALLVDDARGFVTVVVIGAALLADDITVLFAAVFRAYERMRFNATTKVTNRALSTVFAVGALATGGGLLEVVAGYLLGSLFALAYAAYVLRRHFPPVTWRDARRDVVREVIRDGRVLGVAGALNMALFRADAVLVQAFRGAVALGLYGAAYRFFESSLFVCYTLMTASLPRIAKQGPGRAAEHTYSLVVSVALAFYLPLAAGAPFAGEWVIGLLFGDAFRDAAPAVAWLAAAAACYAVAFIARVTTIGLGERRAPLQIAAVALGSNVALNLILIPTYGFVGAAAACFVVEVLEMGLSLRALRRVGINGARAPLALLPAVAAAVMAGALLATGLRGGAALAAGTGIYIATLAVAARVLAPHQARQALATFRR